MKSENTSWFLKGMRDGIPIGLGYFAVSFALGITAKKIGITPIQSMAMSFMMVASAGQYAALTVIASAGGLLQMALTTLVVNLRYLLMSCALSQKVDPKLPMIHRLGISYGVTDEIFGIAMATEGTLNPRYNYGAISVAAPGWALGAFLGGVVGAILPATLVNALGVALYGMFLAIVIPPAKKNHFVAAVVAISMVLSYVSSKIEFVASHPSGRIVVLTVLISAAAAYLYPKYPAPAPSEGKGAGSFDQEGGEVNGL